MSKPDYLENLKKIHRGTTRSIAQNKTRTRQNNLYEKKSLNAELKIDTLSSDTYGVRHHGICPTTRMVLCNRVKLIHSLMLLSKLCRGKADT